MEEDCRVVKRRGGMAYAREDYVPGAPRPRIGKFTSGNSSREFDYTVSLVAQGQTGVSAGALESLRITTNKILEREATRQGYRMTIKVYPHDIDRKHKFMGFAGADRLSQGMRKAFGRPSRRIALVRSNQAVLTVEVDEDRLGLATKALKRGSKKLPSTWKIVFEKKR